MKFFRQLDKCNAKIKTKNDLITESASELVAKFNTGMTSLVTENLQLDTVAKLELIQISDNFNSFID